MAKQSYKIPADLNASYGDMEITLQNKDGMGVKPLPIKVILTYIISVVVCFYLVCNTVVSAGSFLQKALFVVLWVLLTVFLAKFDTTKRMQIELVPTFLTYLPKHSRHVSTTDKSNVDVFMGIVGIESVDDKTGLITYVDGTVGYFYRVVGSASILLFDEDRNAILSRVDSFYRKLKSECECTFITTKASQKIYKQVASLVRKYKALDVKDSDLTYLMNEQLDVLKNYIGHQYKSIHQYMALKADNIEALNAAKQVLQSEIENSTLMFKQCQPMYLDDVVDLLKAIFQGEAVIEDA